MQLRHTEIKVRVEDSGNMFFDLGDASCGFNYSCSMSISELNHWIEELQHIRVRAIKKHQDEEPWPTQQIQRSLK